MSFICRTYTGLEEAISEKKGQLEKWTEDHPLKATDVAIALVAGGFFLTCLTIIPMVYGGSELVANLGANATVQPGFIMLVAGSMLFMMIPKKLKEKTLEEEGGPAPSIAKARDPLHPLSNYKVTYVGVFEGDRRTGDPYAQVKGSIN